MLTRFAGSNFTYHIKVLGYSPIAYWPLWEPSGTVATDVTGNGYNGTYEDVTLGESGIGDGNTCPFFDGSGEYVNFLYAPFIAAFDGAEFTAIAWAKVYDVGVWSDGGWRSIIEFQASSDYRHNWQKPSTTGELFLGRKAGGSYSKYNTLTGQTTTDWVCYGMTCSEAVSQIKTFKDGVQYGSTLTSIGTWDDGLINAAVGKTNWHGWLAHVAIWDKALTPTEMLDLGTLV